ncbi:MAG: hypothetical protein HQL48_00610 [Gammaproteobacteria bacterium]|nr:hypothetical protein [Gammaproteobacteria bacterium]
MQPLVISFKVVISLSPHIVPLLLAGVITLSLTSCGEEAASSTTVTAESEALCQQGRIITTQQPLELAISGQGFFRVLLDSGTEGYTRDGFFALNNDGLLVTRQGYPLQPSIQLTEPPTQLTVAGNGSITYSAPTQTAVVTVGQLSLAAIEHPEKMLLVAENTFIQTEESGAVTPSAPLSGGLGRIVQGALEVPPMCNTFRSDNSTLLNCLQRGFSSSNSALHVAIEGNGLFQITLPDGRTGYSRNGRFSINDSGQLVTMEGYPLTPEITLPLQMKNYKIEGDGRVTYLTPEKQQQFALAGGNEESYRNHAGQLLLADFVNREGLLPAEEGLMVTNSAGEEIPYIDYLVESTASGSPFTAYPKSSGMGELMAMKLETPAACSTYRNANPQTTSTAINLPPQVAAGDDQAVTAGDIVNLSADASDSDGTLSGYSWRQISAGELLPLTGAESANASFPAPQVMEATEVQFQITVVDDADATAADVTLITIYPGPNTSPQANAGGDQIVANGAEVILNGSESYDSDGEIATSLWSQTTGTTVEILNGDLLTASFIAPSVTVATELQFQLSVTDNRGDSASDDVVVTVDPGENSLPIANAGGDQAVASGVAVTLNGSGSSDSDGEIVSYSWRQTSGTGVSILDRDKNSAAFAAPVVAAGTTAILIFELSVTDDRGGVSVDSVIISVANTPNTLPLVDAGSDQAVTQGSTVTLQGLGLDSDGTITAYLWQQLTGTTVSLTSTTTNTTQFTAPSVTTSQVLTFQFGVTDDRGGTSSDTIAVTVNP